MNFSNSSDESDTFSFFFLIASVPASPFSKIGWSSGSETELW